MVHVCLHLSHGLATKVFDGVLVLYCPCIYPPCHLVASRKLFKSSFPVCVSFVRPGTMPAASGTACTNKPFSRINALEDLLLAGTPG